MNIKQISEFETGLFTIEAKKADKDQKDLIKINQKKKKLFVNGNHCSGTRWLNYLIINNTPINYLYTLRNQHEYLDDNNNVVSIPGGKHALLSEKILNQKNIIIIYIIRDFDSFLISFIKNKYDKERSLKTYQNIYEWYCHRIYTNISLLRNSECNYIIVSMEQIQKTKGKSLLDILETHGFEFKKPYDFIEKHTKTGEIEQNHTYFYTNLEKVYKKIYKLTLLIKKKIGLNRNDDRFEYKRNNTKIEDIVKTLSKQPEIRISYK